MPPWAIQYLSSSVDFVLNICFCVSVENGYLLIVVQEIQDGESQ